MEEDMQSFVSTKTQVCAKDKNALIENTQENLLGIYTLYTWDDMDSLLDLLFVQKTKIPSWTYMNIILHSCSLFLVCAKDINTLIENTQANLLGICFIHMRWHGLTLDLSFVQKTKMPSWTYEYNLALYFCPHCVYPRKLMRHMLFIHMRWHGLVLIAGLCKRRKCPYGHKNTIYNLLFFFCRQLKSLEVH